jgi:hypothetical protein
MTTAVERGMPPPFARRGGLYRVLRSLHIVREGPGDVRRESLAFILITWVPLLAIQLVEWLTTGRVEDLFRDLSLHARFLVAAPLLFFAEDTLTERCGTALHQLSARVDPVEADRIARVSERLRAAPFEIILLVLAFYAAELGPKGLTISSSALGDWYRIVAWPLGSFLLLRALWSWVSWCAVLVSFARLPLRPIAVHPDRCGGLGFLSLPSKGFCAVLMAASCIVSGAWATQILFGARKFSIESAAVPFATFLGICLAVTVGPLFAFLPQLYRARLEGLRRFDALSEDYARLFERRWLQGPADDSLLGSADIQSLADLSNAHEIVEKMRVIPFWLDTLAAVTASLCLPLLPLALIEVPFSEAVRKVVGLLLGGE